MKKSTLNALHFVEIVIPGLRVARTYQLRWLRADLLVGVTIFAMLVPQGIAYAQLAGVAPVVGLYTAIGALVGYALFGSSRRLMIGSRSRLPHSWWQQPSHPLLLVAVLHALLY